jgi:hypothetical protein
MEMILGRILLLVLRSFHASYDFRYVLRNESWEVCPYEATVPRTQVYPPCVKRDEILLIKGKCKSCKVIMVPSLVELDAKCYSSMTPIVGCVPRNISTVNSLFVIINMSLLRRFSGCLQVEKYCRVPIRFSSQKET